MSGDYKQFESRKQDHIELALMPDNQALEHNPFDAVQLMHEALPDLDFDALSLRSQRFGEMVEKPFMVSSMTAGHQQSVDINRHLIAACHAMNWVMGVGSQRRELTDPGAAFEWQTLRREFPHVNLFGNLGIAQLIGTALSDIQRLTDALQASALIIHCNPLQECIQPEGTPQFKGCWQALEQLVKGLSLPIVVKETGCGFSPQTLKRLHHIGVSAVDVSGLGGTHWGRIEGHRAGKNAIRQQAAQTFKHWGINTIQSVLHANSIAKAYEIWGSGGVRNGLDAAKLFALGASTVGFAKPMLVAALESTDTVVGLMQTIEYELKVAMFCTGSSTLSDLQEKVCL
jgi:isopentenyl-diphosphate delta-isomerase